MTLTKRQEQALAFIESEIAKTGRSPGRKEIAEAIGYKSIGASNKILHQLKKKEIICWEHYQRYIHVIRPQFSLVSGGQA